MAVPTAATSAISATRSCSSSTRPTSAIDGFKSTWGDLGDSIVVVGGDGMWNCHVHTDDIGAAIEAGIEVGRPHDIHVTDLLEQVADRDAAAPLGARLGARRRGRSPAVTPVVTAVVAVAVGDGLRALLRGLGVQQVVAGGQSMNPSTAQILEAVDACVAEGVVVLPNNKNIVPVAQQVPDLTDLPVAVVPTAAVVEALAALVVYDPDASLDANQSAMTEAAERVRAGEVTQAVRDSVAECGPIANGDWIAITRDGIQRRGEVGGRRRGRAGRRARRRRRRARHRPRGAGRRPRRHRAPRRAPRPTRIPHVEVEVHDGGQPLYPYLIGVE